MVKKRKSKAEFDRLKREVANVYVSRGVNEGHRWTEIYQERRKELLAQHLEIQAKFKEVKDKVNILM